MRIIKITKICLTNIRGRLRIGEHATADFIIIDGFTQEAASHHSSSIHFWPLLSLEIGMGVYTHQKTQILLALTDDIDTINKGTTKAKEGLMNILQKVQRLAIRIIGKMIEMVINILSVLVS